MKVYVVMWLNDDLEWECSQIYPGRDLAKADPHFARKSARILSWSVAEELRADQAEEGWE